MKDLVANLLVRYLEDRGVTHVFGLCGHTNIAVLSAMANSRVHFVNVRHEQVAAHAADGYARATGRASVLLTHLSPGLTNAATGVANAALDCIPMVVIAGDVPTHYFGKHPHQEVNLHADASQYEIYRPFVKRAWRVDTAELLPEILEKAFLLAESGQKIDAAISLDVEDEAMVERVSGRFTCASCGEGYHDDFKRTARQGVCDKCQGTDFSRRADDNAETARARLKAYHAQTAPLIAYYEKQGVLKTVDAMRPIAVIAETLQSVVANGAG